MKRSRTDDVEGDTEVRHVGGANEAFEGKILKRRCEKYGVPEKEAARRLVLLIAKKPATVDN